MPLFRKPQPYTLSSAARTQARTTLKRTAKSPTVAEQRVINQADQANPAGGHISHQHLN